MKKLQLVSVFSLGAILGFGLHAASGTADEHSPDAAPQAQEAETQTAEITKPAEEAPSEEAKPKKKGNSMGFPDFRVGLNETEGCLKSVGGVLSTGQRAMFGWFEDKAAVQRWHQSAMHQGMLDRFFPSHDPNRDALPWLEDGFGPILAVATFTVPPDPTKPISQIAIELYTPIHGGFAIGGMFGPEEFENQFMHPDPGPFGKTEYSPEETKEGEEPTKSIAG